VDGRSAEEGNPTVSRAPQEPIRRRRLVPGLAGLVAALVVAGCSAGQNVQTEVEPAVNGNFGQAGPVLIRDAQFAYPPDGTFPAGGSAPLIVTIVNTGSGDDELVEVSSPVAGDVEITGDRNLPARRAIQVGTPGRTAAPPSAPAVTTTTRPGSSSAVPTSGSSSAPAPTTTSLRPDDIGKATIVLNGLSGPLASGRTYPVTFVFRKAGSVTVELPIANPTTPRPKATGERSAG
jgi:copper(I)-binding protein